MINTSQWSELLRHSYEFLKLEPWNWMDEQDIFAVEDPESRKMIYISILGKIGNEYGLAAYIGQNGLNYLQNMLSPTGGACVYLEQHSILLNYLEKEEIVSEDEKIVKEYGGKLEWKKYPQFRSFKPGYFPWPLEEEEIRLMAEVFEQILQIVQRAHVDKSFLATGKESFFARKYNQKTGLWENGATPANIHSVENKAPLLINEVALQKLTRLKKKYPVPIEIDSTFYPKPVHTKNGGRPFYPSLLISAESERGSVLHYELTSRDHFETKVQNHLFLLVQKLGEIPSEIKVKNKIARILEPVANRLKIKVTLTNELPHIAEAEQELASFLEGQKI